ncbi:hypothetical protein D3C80_1783510 [compost metagenome]
MRSVGDEIRAEPPVADLFKRAVGLGGSQSRVETVGELRVILAKAYSNTRTE